MSIAVNEDLIVVTDTEPDTMVALRYRPESGNVVIESMDMGNIGTRVDMEMFIASLKAVKTTEDNKLARRREALA